MNQHALKIPFNKPYVVGKELYNIARTMFEDHRLSAHGRFTGACHRWLEKRLGCARALLTHSCTGALEMAAMLCNIEPDDEVIMPSFTFVSTANAFVLRGGVPVFVDIRPDTLNMDERLLESAITSRTKAFVPVHYGGVACAMDKIVRIADRHGLWVVEDAATALLSTYKGRPLGTIGHLGCLSFHETKNVTSGEGGALLVNDNRFIERAEVVWEKGTDRCQFKQGRIDKYSWVDIGSSFIPGELVGAFLYAQLEEADRIGRIRDRIFTYYNRLLRPLEEREVIRLPRMGDECTHNSHLFYIITRSLEERKKLIEYLAEKEIDAVSHYVPLHSSPAGKRYGRVAGTMAVTDDVSNRLLRLPFFNEMTPKEVERVVAWVKRFYAGTGR